MTDEQRGYSEEEIQQRLEAQDRRTKWEEQNDLLFNAAKLGDVTLLNRHLSRHAFVNAVNGNGETPLHLAVRSGNAEAVVFLINAGATVDVADRAGVTPLDVAMHEDHNYVLKPLLAMQANPYKAGDNDVPLLRYKPKQNSSYKYLTDVLSGAIATPTADDCHIELDVRDLHLRKLETLEIPATVTNYRSHDGFLDERYLGNHL